MPRREGQLIVEDFFLNTGGLNTADSPFVVKPNQATDGRNFDYIKRGGVQRRAGHGKLNSVANAQVRSLGIALWDKPATAKKVIRAAGTKIQNFDVNAFTFTNLTEDTAVAGSSFLPGTSTHPVNSVMYNSPTSGVLWMDGGGMSRIYGTYNGTTKVTENGVPLITASSFTATPVGSGGTLQSGTYRWVLVFHKASTAALGNATTTVEVGATTVANDSVNLAWTITNNDTTKYDKIYIYRSSLNGAVGFTAGALVAIVNSSVTAYLDTGASVSGSEIVPRVNNLLLDNSPLPTGIYDTLTLFKRRLVTANGSTVYFSDINKPESWPTYQAITVPSGGAVTGLAVVSLTGESSSEIEEVLCVFKQTELWIISGDGIIDQSTSLPNWSLKFVDNSGTAVQSLVVPANGFLFWVSYRGVFMWNGRGKPVYCSQPIEDKFQRQGDIDKSKLVIGYGTYSQARGEVQWTLSSKSIGEQGIVLKLDLKLTLESSGDSLGNKQLSGVFTMDVPGPLFYAGVNCIVASDSTEETQYAGDASGFMYTQYAASDGADAGVPVPFEYSTPYYDFGEPGTSKRFHKVVVWVLESGSYNLSMDFWANYGYKNQDSATRVLPISNVPEGSIALWDVAIWDVSLWGNFFPKVRALTYNIGSQTNNASEGDSFRFKLYNSGTNRQLLIYGFSVYYTEVGLRK